MKPYAIFIGHLEPLYFNHKVREDKGLVLWEYDSKASLYHTWRRARKAFPKGTIVVPIKVEWPDDKATYSFMKGYAMLIWTKYLLKHFPDVKPKYLESTNAT